MDDDVAVPVASATLNAAVGVMVWVGDAVEVILVTAAAVPGRVAASVPPCATAVPVAVGLETVRLSVNTTPNVSANASIPIAASATITSLPTSRRCMFDPLRVDSCAVQWNDNLEGATHAGRAFHQHTPSTNFTPAAHKKTPNPFIANPS